MKAAGCYYAGNDVPCTPAGAGAVLQLVHDKRGCVLVCRAHYDWRQTTSSMPGHGPSCPHPDLAVRIGGRGVAQPGGGS